MINSLNLPNYLLDIIGSVLVQEENIGLVPRN